MSKTWAEVEFEATTSCKGTTVIPVEGIEPDPESSSCIEAVQRAAERMAPTIAGSDTLKPEVLPKMNYKVLRLFPDRDGEPDTDHPLEVQ